MGSDRRYRKSCHQILQLLHQESFLPQHLQGYHTAGRRPAADYFRTDQRPLLSGIQHLVPRSVVRRQAAQLAFGFGLLQPPDRRELLVLQQPLHVQPLYVLVGRLRLRLQLQRLLPELHRERLRPQQTLADARNFCRIRQASVVARRLVHLPGNPRLQLV